MKQLISAVAIDRALFHFGFFLAMAISTSAVLNLATTSDLVSLLLFLPVSLYFLTELGRALYLRFHRFLNPSYFSTPPQSDYYFSLRTFLEQEDKLFMTTLLILAISFCAIIIRLSLSILAKQ